MTKAPLPSLSDTFCWVSGAYSHTGSEGTIFIQYSGINLGRENWGWDQLSTDNNLELQNVTNTITNNFAIHVIYCFCTPKQKQWEFLSKTFGGCNTLLI